MSRSELLACVCVATIEIMPNATPREKAEAACAKLDEAKALLSALFGEGGKA